MNSLSLDNFKLLNTTTLTAICQRGMQTALQHKET